MKTLIKEIGWGSYQEFEGPYFRGKIKFSIGANPTEEQKWLEVFSATESGHYDAINMYDRCIVTVGVAQWCEARQFSVSDMLGYVAEKCGIQVIHSNLMSSFISTNSTFKKLPNKKWRFVFIDNRGVVDTVEKQRELFLGCSGKKNEWQPENKLRAKQWAADLASIWLDENARKAQIEFTISRMKWFFLKEAKEILLDDKTDTPLANMIRAAYASYAGNNPTHAKNALVELMEENRHEKWSYAWCVDLLKKMTFNPKIAIYPGRYDKIRPVLERLWDNIILPKTSAELKLWQPARHDTPTMPERSAKKVLGEIESIVLQAEIDDNKKHASSPPEAQEIIDKPKDDKHTSNERDNSNVILTPSSSIQKEESLYLRIIRFIIDFFAKFKR